MGFSTDAIHAGNAPDPTTGAVSVPIYQTSTYVQEALGRHKGYEYARTQNPTRRALEENLAVLEGGAASRAFASGMAAISTMAAALLKAGDRVVVSDNTYGGTYRVFTQIFANFGIDFAFVNTSDLAAASSAIRPGTRLVHIETPTNPMMRLTDIGALADLTHEAGGLLSVDNTFATPYFQRPLPLGADLVVHSTTKYLNGHSDSVGGAVVSKTRELDDALGFAQNAIGAILSPLDSWLVLRGVKTLAVRMERHESNGRKVARFLSHHDKVQKVFYPGLPDHPEHALAERQMKGFGAMISFELGSLEKARTLLGQVRLCSLGESLGGVETLISHPASMTHASVPPERRKELGITDGLVRISVGIEDVEDIIADLDRALAEVPAGELVSSR